MQALDINWFVTVLLTAVLLLAAMTWRKRTVAASSAERLKLVLWSTGDELWELDLEKDQFTRSNPLRHLKASSHELVTNASELRSEIHPDDRTVFDAALVEHLKGNTDFWDVTYRAHAISGDWHWLRTRGRVVKRSSDGRALRAVGSTGDVTQFKHHELELEQLNHELESRVRERTEDVLATNLSLRETIEQLQAMQTQLVHSEKMAALGNLVAGVAHEINTPLGIGVTAASHLEMETKRLGDAIDANTLTRDSLMQFRQTAMESAQLILRNLMRADKLVRSFKQVAVDQSNEEKRVIDLATYLHEIVTSLKPALKKSAYRIEVNCPAGLQLDTYPGAIYQIVANLVMNSLLHGFDSRPEGLITLDAHAGADQAVLIYRDDGKGMEEEVRRRIFEPFFTTRRGEGGSGLGLHIAWNLATQLLGGTIECQSAPGQGARFELRLPIR